jgi:hypothetical protein
MRKLNSSYANRRENLRSDVLSHFAFQHSKATSLLYGQNTDGLNLIMNSELKVTFFESKGRDYQNRFLYIVKPWKVLSSGTNYLNVR